MISIEAEKASLKRRQLYYELITSLTQSFGRQEEISVLIRNALMMIAMSMKAERVTLVQIDNETKKIFNEYEWREPKLDLQQLPFTGMDFSNGNIFYDTFIIRGDVSMFFSDLEKKPQIAQDLGLAGLKSCIYIPINLYGQFWGLTGIEHYNSSIWNEFDTSIIKLASGAITSLLVKADAEKALIAAREQAEASNQLKLDFISQLSHEIRNTMNIIMGMTTVAISSKSQNQIEYCLGKINEASQQLLEIVNDTFGVSKHEVCRKKLS
jgi:GAF domain-containing protein